MLNPRSLADVVGLSGSTICAIHCLLSPLLLWTGTALSASFLLDESFHRTMVLIVLPTGILAFGLGCWRHKDRAVLLLGLLGLTGLGLSAILLNELLGEFGESIATVCSTAALAVAHLRNWKLCRTDRCNHHCDDVCQPLAEDSASGRR